MKTPTALLFCLTLCAAGAAVAGAPPAPLALAAADAMPYQGKVLSTIDTGQYTYIEVQQDKKTLWLAAPSVALKKGNLIRFEDGAEMVNFHSNTLKRTFPAIRFIGRVALVGDAK